MTTSSPAPSLYGGTYNLFRHTLPKFGIEVTFVEDPDDLDAWRAAVRPNTKAFFAESIGNPRNNVLDVRAVADVAHAGRRAADRRQHRHHPVSCCARWSTAPTS